MGCGLFLGHFKIEKFDVDLMAVLIFINAYQIS